MTIRVIDVETTGVEDDDKICEVAFVELDENALDWPTYQSLVNPQIPIPPETSAIHHITDYMVKDAPLYGDIHEHLMGADIYVAHNAPFDKRFLGGLGGKWICTYRCALHLWPEAPRHSNQTLRYWKRLQGPPDGCGHAHRALYDAYTTARIFIEQCSECDIDDLIDLSNKPALLHKVNFGKHRGSLWSEVDKSYLNWMINQGKKSWDEDTWHTINHHAS